MKGKDLIILALLAAVAWLVYDRLTSYAPIVQAAPVQAPMVQQAAPVQQPAPVVQQEPQPQPPQPTAAPVIVQIVTDQGQQQQAPAAPPVEDPQQAAPEIPASVIQAVPPEPPQAAPAVQPAQQQPAQQQPAPSGAGELSPDQAKAVREYTAVVYASLMKLIEVLPECAAARGCEELRIALQVADQAPMTGHPGVDHFQRALKNELNYLATGIANGDPGKIENGIIAVTTVGNALINYVNALR